VAGVQATAPAERYTCTGSRFPIVDDRVWAYYSSRGGLNTFGCPITRLFLFRGLPAQFFERRIIQLDEQSQPRLLNVLDPDLLPYTPLNGINYPPVDPSMKLRTPQLTSETYVPDLLNFINAEVPEPFHTIYFSLVTPAIAGSTDPTVVAMANVDMWGAPTSPPTPDPDNHNLVHQRFERSIMTYDSTCDCVTEPLLAAYLRDLIMGNPLPADLEAEARSSPLSHQYAPDQPMAVRDPALLPATDLTTAFTPQ
jgi:hypothetical protein